MRCGICVQDNDGNGRDHHSSGSPPGSTMPGETGTVLSAGSTVHSRCLWYIKSEWSLYRVQTYRVTFDSSPLTCKSSLCIQSCSFCQSLCLRFCLSVCLSVASSVSSPLCLSLWVTHLTHLATPLSAPYVYRCLAVQMTSSCSRHAMVSIQPLLAKLPITTA